MGSVAGEDQAGTLFHDGHGRKEQGGTGLCTFPEPAGAGMEGRSVALMLAQSTVIRKDQRGGRLKFLPPYPWMPHRRPPLSSPHRDPWLLGSRQNGDTARRTRRWELKHSSSRAVLPFACHRQCQHSARLFRALSLAFGVQLGCSAGCQPHQDGEHGQGVPAIASDKPRTG